MSLAIKKILYAADTKESALAEAQEVIGQSVDVEGKIDGDNITEYQQK